jgi:PilZ domain
VTNNGDRVPPVELRQHRRQRVLLSGLGFVPHPHSTFDCTIKDISESGARIVIPTDAVVPRRFFLINVKNQMAYEVQIVRRKERDMGVKILRSIELTNVSSPETRQLRQLLVERLQR